MSLNDTPRASRLHIGLFGRCNSGKSSLVNALTGQQTATVSQVAGTTTDPVYKAMELPGIGPVVFMDTAGFDDEGELGSLRLDKTEQVARETDIALVLFHQEEIASELDWVHWFQKQQTPVIAVISQTDRLPDGGASLAEKIREKTGLKAVAVSVMPGSGMDVLQAEIIRRLPEDFAAESITAGLCSPGDTVLLVMPQDIQAPKGRLILPQVQTLRELLDRRCHAVCCTADELDQALALLREPPQLIITDSQVFRAVYEKKTPQSRLTSFSVLFAGYKGDIRYFADSAEKLLSLPPQAHILIAEACTHRPLAEDIGRVKLPRLLRQALGDGIRIDVVAGRDFPQDLRDVDFVIHCGGCMFNRKYVLNRVKTCRTQGVPMSNYGITIAALSGILEAVELPPSRGDES